MKLVEPVDKVRWNAVHCILRFPVLYTVIIIVVLKLFIFFRYLSETSIHHLPYRGLEKLKHLEIENTPNLWDIPDGLIAIATLKTVHVSSEQRFLCCAFEMKRARIGVYQSDENDAKPSANPCGPTSTTPQQKTTPSATSAMVTNDKSTEKTTENPFGGFIGKRRKKRGVSGIEGFLPPTESTSNFTSTLSTATKKRYIFFLLIVLVIY